MSSTNQQLLSLVQLLSHQLDPSKGVSEGEKIDWLNSALRGKKNLIQHLCRMIVTSEDRQETKLALLLLSLIVVLADDVKLDKSVRAAVLEDLSSIEGFWVKVHAVASAASAAETNSVTTQCYAASLMLSAHRLHRKSNIDREWPARLFSDSVIEAIVAVASHHQSSVASTNARILGLCFDYLTAACEAHHERVMSLIGYKAKNIHILLEVSAQLVVAGSRKNEMVGFDPLTANLDQAKLRKFANELVDLGGNKIPTQLALMVVE